MQFKDPSTQTEVQFEFKRHEFYAFSLLDKKIYLTASEFERINRSFSLYLSEPNKLYVDEIENAKWQISGGKNVFTLEKGGTQLEFPLAIMDDIHNLYQSNGDFEIQTIGISFDKGLHVGLSQWISFPFLILIILIFGVWYIWRVTKQHQQKLEAAEARADAEQARADAEQARAETEKVRADSRKWLFEQQEQHLREIGQSLHDDHLNNLKNVMGRVQVLTMQQTNSIEMQEIVKAISDGLTSIADKLHRVSETLFPRWVKDLSLKESLEVFIEDEYKIQNPKISVTMNLVEDKRKIGETTRFQIYRVFQEALHNAAIHGKATNVVVDLQLDGQVIRGCVKDNGAGFDMPDSIEIFSKSSKRLGLLGMQERILMLNGHIEIQSQVGKGTSVRFEAPFR